MAEENWHGQRNCREVSPGNLHPGDTRDLIILDISTTYHHGYGGRIFGSGEDDSGEKNSLSFLWKEKRLSNIVGDLSTMLVKKSVLGILNLGTSVNKKCLSLQQASTDLIWAATGGGAFSNAYHLLALR